MLKKIPNQNIAKLISRYSLSDEAKPLLKQQMTPLEAIDCLQQHRLYNDMVQFIAHALPMIEAIYWASESMKLRLNDWDDNQIMAINAARSWLKQPNETLRIRANQLAERVGLECAPGWVAKAVYWSGTGSIIEPDLPDVMPPTFLYGHSVAAAITIAAAVPQWENYESFYQQTIEQGLEIAKGKLINLDSSSIHI